MITSVIPPLPVEAKSKIDIVFIIDRSGSMGGEINAVKNNISNFANMLESEGIDYQLGLLSYEDSVRRYPLTSNVEEFKNNLRSISVGGGTEDGLDAIEEAINDYTYELNSSKYFIIIGDEIITSDQGNTHEGIKQMLNNNDITVTEISNRVGLFEYLYQATGGQWLNINDDFAETLTSIFEEIQAIPILEVVAPAQNQYLSERNSAFIPQVKVSDPDSDTLSFSYYIDSESSPRDTKSVTNTQTTQTVSFNALDIGTLSEGNHTLRFTVNDGTDTVQDFVDIIVDKTSPTLGSVNVSTTDTSIQISGSASDGIAGLDQKPYRYTVGSTISAWTGSTSYIQGSLIPNTGYEVKFEARDRVGHVARSIHNIYTKAQVPTITVNSSAENSIEFFLNDRNPSTTPYQIKAGTQYVTSTGNLSGTPIWITPTSKTITIKGLSANTSYSLQARAKNQAGVVTDFGNMATGTTLAEPPAEITTNVEQRSITLQWPNTSGADRYDIEVDGAVLNNGTSTTYVHSGLSPNTRHTYRVRVINDGGIGSWSPLVSVMTLPDPPPVPINIQTTTSQTEVALSWDGVADAAGYDIEVDGTITDNGNSTIFVHQGLNPLTEHAYRVRAKNAGGISNWSPAMTVTTLPYPPETPTNITTQITKNSVTLDWSEVDGADAYELEVDGLVVDNGKSISYVHEGLEPLSGHTYRVRAKNLGGKSPWSTPIDITTHPEEPDLPNNVMTTAGEDEITVTWYKVPHAESYEVEVDGRTVVTVTDPQFIHQGLQPDSTHSYRVRAKNISGYSEWSSSVTMRTFPEGDGTTALTNVIAIVTNTDITISWDTVAPNAQYEIEVDGELLDNGSDTIYNHGGLGPKEYHSYRIRLKNETGSGEWVAVLSLATLPNPPDAPNSIQAYTMNNSIELRWERVEGATGYEIEVDGETIEVGNNETYVHEGLTPGTSHSYRVRAKNVTGVTAWSPAISTSTTSPTYTVNVKKNEAFDFSLLASNVQDFSELTFVVTYNPDEVELVDLYNFTPEKDVLSEGQISGTNLNVLYTPGRIEFKVNQNIVPGTSWSGEITTLEFTSKVDGETKLDFVLE
jgi:hypothetical protein